MCFTIYRSLGYELIKFNKKKKHQYSSGIIVMQYLNFPFMNQSVKESSGENVLLLSGIEQLNTIGALIKSVMYFLGPSGF